MVIFTYSNILSSVSLINIRMGVYVGGQVRPLRLFEVLARNRQSAVGLLGAYSGHTRTTTPNVYNTSSTTTVPYHAVGLTKTELYTPHNKHTHTHTKERHTERKKYTIYACKKRDTLTLISVSETSPEKQSSRPYSYHTQHRDAFESEKAKKSKSRERSVSVFQEASI